MHFDVLFLTLKVFSATGGIEKVCRVAGRGITDIADENEKMNVQVFSLHDPDSDIDEKYIPSKNFTGFSNQKIRFIRQASLQGKKSSVVILSHINLLLVGFLIKLISPSTKLVLFAHGIEVWGPLSIFRRKMLSRCDLILAVSSYTKNILHQKFMLPDDKVEVFNNCLDPFLPPPVHTGKDKTLLHQYGFTDSHFIIATLTRLSSKEQYKGYDHVFYAISELRHKYPGIRYMMMGKYDDEEKTRLDGIIQSLNIEAYVCFTGFVPDEELAKHFSIADAYVMPSKKEGFGIVFIEAMYYGLPVVAGSKDGSADAVCDERLGILVNPDSQREITGAIEKLLNNKTAHLPDKELLLKKFSFPVYKRNLKKIFAQLGL
jgi:phosphatidyl-myo-inositol dimannoside synthase